MNVDILAIAAHRDDVEQTCGGTQVASQNSDGPGVSGAILIPVV
jgi:LmbE family N-acetylglucosaminyl deacetylase